MPLIILWLFVNPAATAAADLRQDIGLLQNSLYCSISKRKGGARPFPEVEIKMELFPFSYSLALVFFSLPRAFCSETYLLTDLVLEAIRALYFTSKECNEKLKEVRIDPPNEKENCAEIDKLTFFFFFFFLRFS